LQGVRAVDLAELANAAHRRGSPLVVYEGGSPLALLAEV
jgi:hypothetical protein